MTGFLGGSPRLTGEVALAVDFVQQVVGAQIGGVDFGPRRLHDVRGQPQTLGNRQGVGSPRQADGQAVGGLQGFQVKLHAGVDHAGCAVGVGFQLRVVGGHQGGDAAPQQVIQDGPRQGCALLRVGARPQFVQQHQRAAVGVRQNVDDVGDMPRKGGKRLLDGLLVADVGENLLENADG